ncbi:hypothetical protein SAMN04488020_102292 [Palleronia marisminoris]|uniref:Uncharacterized protein n=1 Tax=Palleronia marisminoris TaxID=315423 RepID=A0A1Y5RWK8_9RHOB|nr:hypothetical protein [Palleronia marisminoris]SFG45929.1 hypothetical protein SAMN04488020_102292 [Palleronia marisminoris]SLN25817.1 hypothetical protein PAM7066_00989 [Palleronia marisminoris]
MKAPARTSPLLLGAALVGAGLVLRNWEPEALRLPDRPTRPHLDRGTSRIARKTRDLIARILPGNMTGSMGRTLVIMGAGLVLVRLLDMAADEQERLF